MVPYLLNHPYPLVNWFWINLDCDFEFGKKTLCRNAALEKLSRRAESFFQAHAFEERYIFWVKGKLTHMRIEREGSAGIGLIIGRNLFNMATIVCIGSVRRLVRACMRLERRRDILSLLRLECCKRRSML